MDKIKKHKEAIFLFLILLIGGILRLAKPSFIPPSLNWDEVSHGYNAYSILKTGKDEWGEFLPTIFRAYGDYKLPAYIYLTTLPVFFFGLSEFSIRIVSGVAGIGSIYFSYQLIKSLFEKKALALLTAFLFAIEPWNLFISRIAVEANLALFFILAGCYSFIEGTKKKNWLFAFSFFLFGLSVWTYNSARIFAPLLLVALCLIYFSEVKEIFQKQKRLVFGSIVAVVLLFAPMFYQLVSPQGQARYGWVQIIDAGAIAKIEYQRSLVNLPYPLPRILWNKATYLLISFFKNYFSHFDPKFLFLTGGTHYQFNVPGHGLLYLISLPFFVIGLVRGIFDMRKSRNVFFVMVWLILAPIASSLTRESPHALRFLIALPVPMLLVSVGIFVTVEFLQKKYKKFTPYFVGILILGYLLSFEGYVKKSTFDYRPQYSWAWQYGYKEIAQYITKNYSSYDKIIITKKYGEPHEFILFWNSWDPENYQNDPNLNRFEQSTWFWVDSFDKYFFVNDWQIRERETEESFVLESGNIISCQKGSKCLLVTSHGNAPSRWHKLEVVNFLDGTPAFEIYDNI